MNLTNRRKTTTPACVGALLLLHIFVGAGLVPAPTVFTARGAQSERTANNDDATLLEIGGKAKIIPEDAPAELKIISYNMRWRGGEELRRLIELLRADPEIGGAQIIGLQEVDRNRERTARTNTARLIAEELGLHYAWAAPPAVNAGDEEETGVAVLSAYPMSDVERIVLPHEGPGRRRRAAIGATLRLSATQSVRVYSVHAETRIPVEKKMDQLRAVVESLDRRPAVKRAVVLGDFNTIKGKDVRGARQLFAAANFVTPFADERKTWRTLVFKLKLDWIWLRGLDATGHDIVRRIGLSDHWPLWVKVKL